MANTTKSIQQILASDELTSYEVWRLLTTSVALIDPDRAASIPPQQMYNYTRNGLIAKGKKGSGKDIRYTVTEADAFIAKWTKKNLGTEIHVLTEKQSTKQHRDTASLQSAARG